MKHPNPLVYQLKNTPLTFAREHSGFLIFTADVIACTIMLAIFLFVPGGLGTVIDTAMGRTVPPPSPAIITLAGLF